MEKGLVDTGWEWENGTHWESRKDTRVSPRVKHTASAGCYRSSDRHSVMTRGVGGGGRLSTEGMHVSL